MFTVSKFRSTCNFQLRRTTLTTLFIEQNKYKKKYKIYLNVKLKAVDNFKNLEKDVGEKNFALFNNLRPLQFRVYADFLHNFLNSD